MGYCTVHTNRGILLYPHTVYRCPLLFFFSRPAESVVSKLTVDYLMPRPRKYCTRVLNRSFLVKTTGENTAAQKKIKTKNTNIAI